MVEDVSGLGVENPARCLLPQAGKSVGDPLLAAKAQASPRDPTTTFDLGFISRLEVLCNRSHLQMRSLERGIHAPPILP